MAEAMTDYADPPAPRRIRFDPTRTRGVDAFTRAQSHSRRVRWLKFILPGIAIAGIAGFFLTMRVVSGSGEAVIALAGLNVASKSLVMKAPHISGFSGTEQSYELKATQAVQDLDNPKLVKLEAINGHFGIGNKQTATITAGAGLFDGTGNTLRLMDGIQLTTTDGYKARLAEAQIDIGKGNLVSTKPLEIYAEDGSIRANGIQVSDRGTHVIFSGGVRVSFTPSDDAPAAAPVPDSDALAKAAARLKSATE